MARNKLKKILIGSFFLIFFAVILLLIFPQFLFWSFFVKPSINEINSNIERSIPTFQRDLEETAYVDKLLSYGNKRDAAIYLNPLLKWKGNESYIKKYEVRTKRIPSIHVDKNISNQFKKGWLHKKPQDVSQYSTRWFAKLKKYDHWTFEKHSPLELAINDGKYNPSFLPSPSLNTIQTWSKILLIKSRQWKSSDNAFKVLLHLAKLVYSSETLVSSMLAVKILSHMGDFYRRYPQRFEKNYDSLKYFDEHEFKKIGKMLIFSLSGFSYIVEPKLMLRMFSNKGFGLCAAINDTGWQSQISRSLAKTTDKDYMKATRAILKKFEHCNLFHLRKYWNRKLKTRNVWSTKLERKYKSDFKIFSEEKYLDELAGLISSSITIGDSVYLKN